MTSLTLRPYQQEPARAILRSVRRGLGLTFTVEMARQSGKNELSAQLETLLLLLHAAQGGQGLKASPTFRPQTIISMQRLTDRLRDRRLPFERRYGYQVRLARARWIFMTGGPTANVVGETASLLLEGDEAQDLSIEKWDRDFRPMGAATNVTTVLYGTAWDDASLLERTRRENAEREAADGIRRNFVYDWQAVGACNPAYLTYVEAERQRLGETHPLFQTQYALLPLAQRARMFSQAQLTALHGSFPVQDLPRPDDVHVAGIDIAGAAEIPDEQDINAVQGRDSTTLTIGALREGRLDLVAAYCWTDRPHHATKREVIRLARPWNLRHLVADATGAGEPYAQDLARSLGRIVTPFVFTAPARSELAYQLLARVNRGELRIAAGAPQDLWDQLRLARTHVRPNRQMAFAVDPREGHDDWLMSIALLAYAADSLPAPRFAHGR